jgi:hypothetical protein
MNTAVSLKNKQTSTFKELISQRDSDEISFFNALSQERIIQNNLEKYTFKHKEGTLGCLTAYHKMIIAYCWDSNADKHIISPQNPSSFKLFK